jgi:hypothetical protein
MQDKEGGTPLAVLPGMKAQGYLCRQFAPVAESGETAVADNDLTIVPCARQRGQQ